MNTDKKNILIVGGGAGGLELAARLSRSKYNHCLYEITLIDCKLKHVWKPLLHEVATGTLLSNEDEIDYISYASGKFKWEYGSIQAIDRAQKQIIVDPVIDEAGNEILSQRRFSYDYLVLAIGSISNDFSIPGVKEHCVFLDNLQQAEILNKLFLQHIIQLLSGDKTKSFKIAIIGGGATGVELAAEIQYALSEANKMRKREVAYQLEISVIESGNRILPQLPERISKAVEKYLQKIGVTIINNEFVNEVASGCVHTKNGKEIKADLIIWAAGVKVEAIVKNFDGLEINAINQLCVSETLQTTKDPNIFAFGDCSGLLRKTPDGKMLPVPPKAQAAHQQATLLARSLITIMKGGEPLKFIYKDYGSLITVSKYETFGSLMSRISHSIYIEGAIARMTYWMLYKKHQMVLWGLGRVILMTIGNFISSRVRPKLKLH